MSDEQPVEVAQTPVETPVAPEAVSYVNTDGTFNRDAFPDD